MNSVERVKFLCKERKIPLSRLERDLGFANGYIGQLRKGVFPDDRLAMIANYLCVSYEYLLTGEGVKKEITPGGERPEDSRISQAYFRIMQDAQEKGIPPEDLQMALDFIERARRRDQEQ